MTAMSATATRQRLLEYVERLPDREVLRLAEQLLPPAAAEQPDALSDVDLNDPLLFTEEESRARIEAAVARLEAGEKTIPWAEVKARMHERQAARVQR